MEDKILKKLIAKFLLSTMIVPSLMSGLNHTYALPGDTNATNPNQEVDIDLNKLPLLKNFLQPILDCINVTDVPGKRLLDFSKFKMFYTLRLCNSSDYMDIISDIIYRRGGKLYSELFGKIDGLKFSYKDILALQEDYYRHIFEKDYISRRDLLDQIIIAFLYTKEKLYVDYIDPSDYYKQTKLKYFLTHARDNRDNNVECDTLLICKSEDLNVDKWLEFCNPENEFSKFLDLHKTKRINYIGTLTEEEKQKIAAFFKSWYGIENLEFKQNENADDVNVTEGGQSSKTELDAPDESSSDVNVTESKQSGKTKLDTPDESSSDVNVTKGEQPGKTKLDVPDLATVFKYVEQESFKSPFYPYNPLHIQTCYEFPLINENAQMATVSVGKEVNVCLDDMNAEKLIRYASTIDKDIQTITISPLFISRMRDAYQMKSFIEQLKSKFRNLGVIKIDLNPLIHFVHIHPSWFSSLKDFIATCENTENIRIKHSGVFHFFYFHGAGFNNGFVDYMSTKEHDDIKKHDNIKVIYIKCIYIDGGLDGYGLEIFPVDSFLNDIQQIKQDKVYVIVDSQFLMLAEDYPNIENFLKSLQKNPKVQLDYKYFTFK